MMDAATIFSAAVLGGLWRRWYGGALHDTPLAIPSLGKIAVGMALCGAVLVGSGAPLSWQTAVVAVLAGALWRPGHGSYMDMGTTPHTDDESLAPVIRPFQRILRLEEGGVAWDVVGMSLRYGLLTMLVAGVMQWFAMGTPLVFGVSGFLAGPIYWAALRVNERWRFVKEFTEIGEAALGAVIYGALTVALKV